MKCLATFICYFPRDIYIWCRLKKTMHPYYPLVTVVDLVCGESLAMLYLVCTCTLADAKTAHVLQALRWTVYLHYDLCVNRYWFLSSAWTCIYLLCEYLNFVAFFAFVVFRVTAFCSQLNYPPVCYSLAKNSFKTCSIIVRLVLHVWKWCRTFLIVYCKTPWIAPLCMQPPITSICMYKALNHPVTARGINPLEVWLPLLF